MTTASSNNATPARYVPTLAHSASTPGCRPWRPTVPMRSCGVYYNFFQPILRLVEKTVIPVEGGGYKTKLRHDAAKTPFDRLCATKVLTTDKQESLQRLRDQTNPRQLKQQIYDLIDHTLALPCADACDPGTSPDEGGSAG